MSNSRSRAERSGCRWILTGCAFVGGIAFFGLIGIVASIYVLAPIPVFEPVSVETAGLASADCTEEAARAYRAEWMAFSEDMELIPEDAESFDEANPESMRAVADALGELDIPSCLEPLREADAALFYDVSDMIQRGRDGSGPQFWRVSITMFRLVRSVKPHIDHTNEVMTAIEEAHGISFYDEDIVEPAGTMDGYP